MYLNLHKNIIRHQDTTITLFGILLPI